MRWRLVVWAGLAGSACSAGGTGPDRWDTGLEGVVVRGPIAPVCREGAPCDAPFAARFDVERAGRTVASFESDSGGRFAVRLAPGSYVIVPAASAPLMAPRSQRRQVEVEESPGRTPVALSFDTGIR
jgi:hypothetical protein